MFFFVSSGSYLLSGGHECVLVKWHHDTGYKDYMPRLGAPLNHIACSSDNLMYATCYDDNGERRLVYFLYSTLFQLLTVGKFPNH